MTGLVDEQGRALADSPVLAKALGVSTNQIYMWSRRWESNDFPAPTHHRDVGVRPRYAPKAKYLWVLDDVLEWHRNYVPGKRNHGRTKRSARSVGAGDDHDHSEGLGVMGILNYSTSVDPTKTAGEIQAVLAKHGATLVSTVYAGGAPIGIAFTIATEHGDREFRLPANPAGVEKAIEREYRAGQVPNRYRGTEQATRVAWRILKDWVASQLAVIEAGMASLDEVMMPYMLTNSGETLMAVYRSNLSMRQAISGPAQLKSGN